MTEQDPAASAFYEGIRVISDAFRPVLEAKEGSGGRKVIGTALVVGEANTRFVVTANHVVSGPKAKFIGVTGQDTVSWPRRYSILEAKQQGLPDADVAWVTATVSDNDTVFRAHLPMALARAAIPDAEGPVYVAVGFPGSKSKLWHGEGRLAAKLMSAVVQKAPRESWEQLALDERVQIAMTYSQDARTSLDGAPVVGSHPRGMSGGALMALMRAGDNISVAIPFLIGILTQYHDDIDTLVATRVSHLWDATPAFGRADGLYRQAEQPVT